METRCSFIEEIVPRAALTFVANTLYGEHYETPPMQHTWKTEANKLKVEYAGRNHCGIRFR